VSTDFSKHVILYAEDDMDDFESVEEVVKQLSDKHQLINAKNGAEAVEYLEQHPDNHPCLIILDLNMPVMSGKEVLVWLSGNRTFNKIPVMVFTTSSREEDVKLCQKHACTFFRKPTLYRDLLHIVQTMLQMCDGKSSS
jgi:CheY-like chemotaxis protein